MQERRRLRVVISAYACEPGRGSEPGVGWEVMRGLASHHDLTVVTRPMYRAAIEAQVAREGGDLRAVSMVYLGLPRHLEPWLERRGWGENLNYFVWQGRLHRWLRRQPPVFDVAHHLTFVRYWMTPGVAGVPGLPFVIGPVGGADSAPPMLLPTLSARGRLAEATRGMVREAFAAAPGLRRAYEASGVAIATSAGTLRTLRRLGARDARLASDVNTRLDWIAEPRSGPPAGPPLVIGVGRLIEWKAYHLGLMAWARSGVPGTFEIYGAGPSLERLQSLAAALGVADRVTLHGQVPRGVVLDAMARARALLHPSLHDSGGYAILESLQNGVPVVCWDHAGPGTMVDSTCGVAVAVDPAGLEPSLDAMAAALRRVVTDDASWTTLSAGALERVRTRLSLPVHVERLDAAYRSAIEAARAPVDREAVDRPIASR